MRSTTLAEKYAKALYGCAKEDGKEKAIADMLIEFSEAMKANDISSFAKSPLIQPAEKKGTILAVSKQLAFNETFQNFVMVLADNDRLYLAGEIQECYQNILDDASGVTRGTATSAKELNDSEKEEITSVISKLTNKKVMLDFDTNPELIGSLVAQVGSLTIDDSLKTHLNRLEDDLNRRV